MRLVRILLALACSQLGARPTSAERVIADAEAQVADEHLQLLQRGLSLGPSLLQAHLRLEESSRPASGRLPLVPFPAKLSLGGEGAGTFSLSANTPVVLGEGISETDPAVKALRAHLATLHSRSLLRLTETAHRSASAQASIRLQLVPERQSDEGYSLVVSREAVELHASSHAGLFYSVQTLRQLTPENGPADLVYVNIEDHPRFAWRGLHLDVSRHFFTAVDVKKLLDVMSMLKLNRFHWHLTDDQGWRLPVEGYPKLSTVAADGVSIGAYTADEIRGVVAYAHARHIKVIPEVDVPGHAAAAIAAYPELGNSDVAHWAAPTGPMRTWGTFKYTMTPSEDTMRFLQTVFDQVADLFPDGMVHIGGDEVSKEEWQDSRRARALLQTEHLHNVQAYFNTRCAELLRSKNISMLAWDEAPAVGGFPEDGIVVAWRSANEVVKAARQGRRVINADQDALYFDHYQGPAASEPKAFGGFSPLEKVYAYDPVPAALTEEQQHHIMGGQAQLWSEYIPNWEHAEYMAFPRAYALAERLWSPKMQANSFTEFKKRLASRLQELDGMGVAYRKI